MKRSYDVTHLPTFAFGPGNPLWWGTAAFMLIEGLAFVFAIAAYLYFYHHNRSWPLAPQPQLFWSTLITALLLISEAPNVWLKKAATRHDVRRVRIGLLLMSAVGLAAMVLRGFEFTTLNVSWDTNAYGSIVWFLLGFHTVHLVTDVVETWVITFCLFAGPVDMRRFPEVQDNQDYWHFVVFFWLLIYGVLYWLPRWLEVPA